jgi:hypothetical protein
LIVPNRVSRSSSVTAKSDRAAEEAGDSVVVAPPEILANTPTKRLKLGSKTHDLRSYNKTSIC